VSTPCTAPRRRDLRRTLRIPADLASLPRVREILIDGLERQGWGREDVWRALLVAQEALVNAVEHGSTGGGRVEVRLAVGRSRARVWIRDGGRPGVPSPSAPVVTPPPSQAHGRGRLLMQVLADAFESRPAGSGTEVGLLFRRRPASAPAPRPRLVIG
jgi:anti-sigma regulatory factor (Ser/Thr protein kinase)